VSAADGHLGTVRELVGTHLLVVPGVAAAVLADDHLLLLLHAESHRWVLPGGAVEPDEHPADAILREVAEETGLRVRPERIIAVGGGSDHHRHYRNGDEVSYVTTVFRCTPTGGELRCDEHEALDLRWVPLAEVPAVDGVAGWVVDLLPHLDTEAARFRAAGG
jgi:8-oxo-dGTP pyrophosphatase MutT (NUDIX family)